MLQAYLPARAREEGMYEKGENPLRVCRMQAFSPLMVQHTEFRKPVNYLL